MDTLERPTMKVTLLLGGLSVLSLLAEAAAGSEYGSLSPWANLGALACVVSLLVFLVCKHIPKLIHDHAKEIRDARAEYSSTLDRMSDRYERREKIRDESLEHLTTRIHELAVICTRHQSGNNHTVEM